jgi:hypothetical protein
MNITQTKTEKGIVRNATSLVVMLFVSILFAACDGANQGVQIGNGQSTDPVVIDYPIAYIRSPIPVDDNGDFVQQDLREQITFEFGADLYYRDRASPSAESVNITGEITQGLGAIRDVEIAYDGSKLLFSMRTPFDPNVNEEDLPTWNMWQYTFETDLLEPVIPPGLTSEAGHDIMPKYLPDGRIVFASTRQIRSQAVLLDEGKGGFPALDEDQNEFAFNLHVVSEDGLTIEQISFNQSHDLDPSVLSNGQIVFSRWDHVAQNNSVNLYRMNPDGSGLELLYGQQSHATGTNGELVQFMQPRELEDGRIMSLIRPFTNTEGGGEIIVIDTPQYLENTQPTRVNIGILNGPAQEDATINEVLTTAGVPSPGGRYSSVYPILDGSGRLMVSWSQCRLLEILPDDGDMATDDFRIVACTDERLAMVDPIDPNNVVIPPVGAFIIAPPLYGIWIYDPAEDTQLPVVVGEEGFMFTEVVVADPKSAPPVILDNTDIFTLDPTIADVSEAVLNIRSVYDFDGAPIVDIATMSDPSVTPAPARLARFLRIEKAVSIPDDDIVDLDNTDFGVSTQQGMREIVAYAMIEPDGSVMTKVPANTALAISVLDENGKRITARHLNWISLRPGQELKCQGCHVANSGLSHGRVEAFDSAYAGANAATVGGPFPNTNPTWLVENLGETMAETRARQTCASTVDKCSSIEPSINVVYEDVWTDIADRALDLPFAYRYSDLTVNLVPTINIWESPTTNACESDWASNCRIIINYIANIHPLWSQQRLLFDDVGAPVLDANLVQVDNNCLGCHTPIDPADGVTVRIPAGQLELQDGLSPDEPDHYHAYRELLVGDNLQTIDNGALVDATRPDVDVDGNPIDVVIPIGSPASIAGARASGNFFNRFEDPQDTIHYNILSNSERRLIAEWLDVGAQYYNNPFDVPQ